MNTRNFGIALVAGLAFAALNIASVNAETTDVVGSADGCSWSYSDTFTADGAPVSAITVSCPRLPAQVASTQQS